MLIDWIYLSYISYAESVINSLLIENAQVTMIRGRFNFKIPPN